MGADCVISTKLVSSATSISGSISLCTAEGIQPGTPLAGVTTTANKLQLLAGKCLKTSDCNSTDLMCSTANITQVCTCNAATGMEDCVDYGACVPTPCKTCQECINAVKTNFIRGQVRGQLQYMQMLVAVDSKHLKQSVLPV